MRQFLVLMTTSLALAAARLAVAGEAPLDLRWAQLPSLPDRLGVAGAYAGVSEGVLLVAGGANFPDKMPWDGGKKVWHDTVYALDPTNGGWRTVGRLPRPLGYGVSVTSKLGVVCIGGSDAEKHHAETYLLNYTGGEVRVKPLPALPIPLANASGALLGEAVYVCAGATEPGEQSALNRFFKLDLAHSQPVWRELAACPGEARILPVAGAANNSLYLVGGAALRSTDGTVKRVYLRDAWRFIPDQGWQKLPDLPRPCVAAASPAPVVDSTLLLVGGDDGSLAGFQPLPEHPGFPRGVLAFDLRAQEWRRLGETPAARATLPVVKWQGRFVLPSGEIRPGMRSPEVWTLSVNSRLP